MSEEWIKSQAETEWSNFRALSLGKTEEEQGHIFRELFRMALKTQDRNTRHKCAESVEAVALKEAPDICKTQAACAACMNVQAI